MAPIWSSSQLPQVSNFISLIQVFRLFLAFNNVRSLNRLNGEELILFIDLVANLFS